MRDNADELQEYIKSLNTWEDELKVKESAKQPEKKEVRTLPPIRNASGQESASAPVSTQAPTSASTQSATAKVGDNVSAAIKEKDKVSDNCITLTFNVLKGNEYFNQGKYTEAVASYTRAINLDISNPILPANRAMAHLKLRKYVSTYCK